MLSNSFLQAGGLGLREDNSISLKFKPEKQKLEIIMKKHENLFWTECSQIFLIGHIFIERLHRPRIKLL